MICTKKKHLDVCNIECKEYFECRERKQNLTRLLKRGVVISDRAHKRDYVSDKRKIKKDDPLRNEKIDTLRAAYDLFYDEQCCNDIINATRLYDIDLAMINGRIRKFGID